MQSGPVYLTDFDLNQAFPYLSPASGQAYGQTPSGVTIDPSHLGQIGQTGDGSLYRLVAVGGTSTVAPGTLLVAPAVNSDFAGLAIAAASEQPSNTAFGNATSSANSALAAGSYQFVVVNGSSSAITNDQFAGGYVLVNQTSGTDNGPVKFKLQGNTAAAESANVTLTLETPLNVASALVPGTDTVSLVPSPWNGSAPSATLGQPVGVTAVQVPNSSTATYAAWVQTKGLTYALEDDVASIANEPVGQSTTTAGDVTKWTASTFGKVVGSAQTAATSEAVGVVLSID